jgi:NAD-dependent dihydropyrimidine dehydrogenase PreA subunit
MRTDALFIGIEVDDDAARDPALAAKLTEVCPVDIYAEDEDPATRSAGGPRLRIVEENVDECVLCRLCIDAAPPGTVKVLKLYDNAAVL